MEDANANRNTTAEAPVDKSEASTLRNTDEVVTSAPTGTSGNYNDNNNNSDSDSSNHEDEDGTRIQPLQQQYPHHVKVDFFQLRVSFLHCIQ